MDDCGPRSISCLLTVLVYQTWIMQRCSVCVLAELQLCHGVRSVLNLLLWQTLLHGKLFHDEEYCRRLFGSGACQESVIHGIGSPHFRTINHLEHISHLYRIGHTQNTHACKPPLGRHHQRSLPDLQENNMNRR